MTENAWLVGIPDNTTGHCRPTITSDIIGRHFGPCGAAFRLNILIVLYVHVGFPCCRSVLSQQLYAVQRNAVRSVERTL